MKLRVHFYADSDFSGLLSYKDPHNPVCARSRSGYVLTFTNCPILWVFKLHTEIALSTLHSGYVALLQLLRDLLPLKALAKYTLKGLVINTKKIKVLLNY